MAAHIQNGLVTAEFEPIRLHSCPSCQVILDNWNPQYRPIVKRVLHVQQNVLYPHTEQASLSEVESLMGLRTASIRDFYRQCVRLYFPTKCLNCFLVPASCQPQRIPRQCTLWCYRRFIVSEWLCRPPRLSVPVQHSLNRSTKTDTLSCNYD